MRLFTDKILKGTKKHPQMTARLSIPSLTTGLSPEDILLLAGDPGQLIELYGRDAALRLLTLRYERRQLLRLLQGDLAPNDEQAAFLAGVQRGLPIRLNDNGLTLRKVAGGWLCRRDGLAVMRLCPTPAEALHLQAEPAG